MSSLSKQNTDFVRRLAQQPVFSKPVSSNPSPSPSPSSSPPPPPSSSSKYIHKHNAKKLGPPSVAIQASLITILDYLKKSGTTPKSLTEIFDDTRIDLRTMQDLDSYLQNHPKIAYDSESNSYSYVPEFVIEDKEQLYQWIASRNKYPIDFSTIANAYTGVTDSLLELEQEKKIYLLRNKAGGPHLIFFNRWYDAEDYEMNPLFKDEFFKLKVPDDIDLAKQLSQAGIKIGETTDGHPSNKKKEKKAKDKKRRIKLTNLHLAGTDMDVGKLLNIDILNTTTTTTTTTTAAPTKSSFSSSLPFKSKR